ncbi:MAG TPA: ornithine carbamoyltransferase [Alphaproteobacteria bacterium]|nr:ornithine carbamoyltransferase [Alphaproteobacteria bacterium]
MTQAPKHFINLPEIPDETLKAILKAAHALKKQKYTPPQLLDGLSLAMIFDKRSTRTRLSFEIAMKQLGGHTLVMTKDDMQLGGSESIEDTAKVLSRFVDAVMIRISNHSMVEELASFSSIPIINALTDESHPCQIMADIMTIEEKLGSIAGKKLAWFGDYNNVAKTFVQAAPKFDFELKLAVPEPLLPDNCDLLNQGNISIGSDPIHAAQNADVIITDTWVSMGQEGKTIDMFLPYRVNSELMSNAKSEAIFMHCMPIHRGEEVTDEVLNSPACVIYDEAENRLHAQKAILAYCMQNSGVQVQTTKESLFG